MTNAEPSVSVHIVTCNSATTLNTCLASVRAQRDVEFEVHVFDNGSTDDSCALVRAAGFSLIENSQNIGYGAAHNALIEATRSQFALTLNPDVWLHPDFLKVMQSALNEPSASRVGSAAGLLFRVNTLGEEPHAIDSAGLLMRRSRRQGLRLEGVPFSQAPTQPTAIFGPDGAAAFYRRAVLDDIRLSGQVFDADFFMHKEDIDLCWRIQLRGWSALFVPGAVAHHVRTFRPGQRRSTASLLRFCAVRNRYLMMLKNERRGHLQQDLLAIVRYELGILLYILLVERSSLSAYRAAWQLRKRMLQKRHEIQESACVDWRELRRWFEG